MPKQKPGMKPAHLPYTSLRAWLKGTGTTQRELAREANIPESTISDLLNCKEYCGMASAIRLHEITGVPVEKFVDWELLRRSRRSERAA
jgi:plasmid maintenance system antidote protein VapI